MYPGEESYLTPPGQKQKHLVYCNIYPKYLGRQTLANLVNPDQTPQNTVRHSCSSFRCPAGSEMEPPPLQPPAPLSPQHTHTLLPEILMGNLKRVTPLDRSAGTSLQKHAY